MARGVKMFSPRNRVIKTYERNVDSPEATKIKPRDM